MIFETKCHLYFLLTNKISFRRLIGLSNIRGHCLKPCPICCVLAMASFLHKGTIHILRYHFRGGGIWKGQFLLSFSTQYLLACPMLFFCKNLSFKWLISKTKELRKIRPTKSRKNIIIWVLFFTHFVPLISILAPKIMEEWNNQLYC